jgi:hypothetical protein
MNPHAAGTPEELDIEWVTIPLVFALVALVFLAVSPGWRMSGAEMAGAFQPLPWLEPRLEPCGQDADATAMQPPADPVPSTVRAGASAAPPASS